MVGEFPAVRGRIDAQRKSRAENEQQRGELQLQAGDDPWADQVENRFTIDDRAAEIEGGHVTNEHSELLDIRTIGTDALARELNLLGCGVGRQNQKRGITRRAGRDKKDDHEHDQRDERLHHATDDVFDGNLPWSSRLLWTLRLSRTRRSRSRGVPMDARSMRERSPPRGLVNERTGSLRLFAAGSARRLPRKWLQGPHTRERP